MKINFKIVILLALLLSLFESKANDNSDILDSLTLRLNSTNDASEKFLLRYKIADFKLIMRESFWDSLLVEVENFGNSEIESRIYNNMGLINKEKGNVIKALEYYHKSLKIEERLNNKEGLATTLNNIGVLHDNLGDREKALYYYKISLKITKELKLPSLADRYWNIATLLKDNIDSNTYYLRLAGDEYYRQGGDYGLGSYHYVLGTIQSRDKMYSSSATHFKKALQHYKNLKHINYIGRCYAQIAKAYFNNKQPELAKNYTDSAYKISSENGIIYGMINSTELLYLYHFDIKKYEKALYFYKLHVKMVDSLSNETNQKAAAQQQAKYEYEKQKAVDDAEHEKQLAIEQEAKEKQQILTYATAGGLGLVGIFLIFVFNRLKVTRKQKGIIELAHTELEEKNTEILDSIQYAKRIQSAILPADKVVKEYLQESLILYKPKDIVAGDFYWLEQKENKVLFAAADCTGHGVPGAMVSVVCNNGLNRSVREYGLTDPGKILDKTREIVVEEFEKSEEEVKDGMDIAICSLEGNTLQYAGAHNPLWIIREGELLETKANKQPIGQFENPEPYRTHTIELQKGDSIYIFSDGYADQFGGEKGKKMKTANFKKLLLSIQQETMDKQKQLIDEAFETWKGELEQLDDVCVIGVRV